VKWAPLNLRNHSVGFEIPNDAIAYDVNDDERLRLAKLLKPGEGVASPLILLSKIYAVLKWRYRMSDSPASLAMAVLNDFSEALRKIADLEIGAVPEVIEMSKFERTTYGQSNRKSRSGSTTKARAKRPNVQTRTSTKSRP
jgi:hypothetical protein